jgi:hypothetical protein
MDKEYFIGVSNGYMCINPWIIEYIRREEQKKREEHRPQPEISDVVDNPEKEEEAPRERGVVIINSDNPDENESSNNGITVINMRYLA